MNNSASNIKANENERFMNSPNFNENGELKQPAVNNSASKINDPWYKKFIRPAVAVIIVIIVGVSFCVVGATLLYTDFLQDDYKIVIDYTDCKTNDLPNPIKCKDSLNTTGKECTCYVQLEIKELMKAPVTVYYELESYEQITSSYAQSRDDNQLAGHLSPEPSASCGSYSYTGEKKPIAPCGQLADAMFNDTFYLQANNEYIFSIHHDLISEDDKQQFRNPPGNLTQAFKDFSKPKNWRNEVYELDTSNPENNGFRNEAFIIWMKTDLKQKPVWRVNHTGENESGLGPANYTLRVTYGYPPSRYDGRRKFIISSGHKVKDSAKYVGGVALVFIGTCCIVTAIVVLLLKRFYNRIFQVCGASE